MFFDLWDYNSKKNVTLKKHMAIKHQDHKDDGNDDEVFGLSVIKYHKDENPKSKKSYVFRESMLDEFDPMLK